MIKKWLIPVFAITWLLFFLLPAAAQDASATVTTRVLQAGVGSIEVPLVSGLANSEAERKINTVLLASVEQFQQSILDNPHTISAAGRYEIHQNGDGILSLTMRQYTYSGGAHGMTYMQGYTFDLGSGERYAFSDLLAPYDRGEAEAEIGRQISERKIPLLGPFAGLKPEADFYLEPGRKLVVFYQLYELAPYAWGFVRFPLAY